MINWGLFVPLACFHQENWKLYDSRHENYHIGGSLTSLPTSHNRNPRKFRKLAEQPQNNKRKIPNSIAYFSSINKATSNRRMKTSYVDLIFCTRENSHKFHIRNSIYLNNKRRSLNLSQNAPSTYLYSCSTIV